MGPNAREEWVLKGAGNANMVFSYEGNDPRLVSEFLKHPVSKRRSYALEWIPAKQSTSSNANLTNHLLKGCSDGMMGSEQKQASHL